MKSTIHINIYLIIAPQQYGPIWIPGQSMWDLWWLV